MTEGMPLTDWIDWYLFTAGMNVDYHRRMEWWWNFGNRALIILALLCGGWCIYSATKKALAESSLRWSIVALLLMGVCLLIPAGDYANDYKSLAKEWTDVEAEVKVLESRITAGAEETEITTMKEEILRKVAAIEKEEPSAYWFILDQCWAAQAEKFYGKGVDTPKKIDEYREKHNLPPIEYGGPPVAVAD